MSFEGKVAVVTGAGRGIGVEVAKVLAEKGAAVGVWDLSAEGAEETAAAIRAKGGKAIAVSCDTSDATAVAAAAKATRDAFGPVTILCNNAGITTYAKFTDLTEEVWDHMIKVNLKSPFLVTQAIISDMLAAGWGRIINISSSSTQSGAPSSSHYVASKGGVIGLTKALALEYIDKGITVNNVPPGVVDTPLLRQGFDVEELAQHLPMKRIGQPSDIAHAVAYLASEEAGYVTGHTLSVNGGRYMN